MTLTAATRDSSTSASALRVYRQLTFLPARLITASVPSISRDQSPSVFPSHATARPDPVYFSADRVRITASSPRDTSSRAIDCPMNPLPPAMMIRLRLIGIPLTHEPSSTAPPHRLR